MESGQRRCRDLRYTNCTPEYSISTGGLLRKAGFGRVRIVGKLKAMLEIGEQREP